MKYYSIEPIRCLNLNEKILKPFLCNDCKNLPLKAFKLKPRSFDFYCETSVKKSYNQQIFEDNLGLAKILIACKFSKNGCKNKFYYENL